MTPLVVSQSWPLRCSQLVMRLRCVAGGRLRKHSTVNDVTGRVQPADDGLVVHRWQLLMHGRILRTACL